jgi:hypothetical protein
MQFGSSFTLRRSTSSVANCHIGAASEFSDDCLSGLHIDEKRIPMSPIFKFHWKATKQDLRSDLDRLRWQLAKCIEIRDSATDAAQRDLYSVLAQHYQERMTEIERDIRNKQGDGRF